MKIKFIGATREVTGSKHLIITDSGKKILLDCGMFQGKGMETDAANRDLGFTPSEIDYVLVSHAHIDHTGLIPYIYKNGFNGKVICTPATKDLCSIMLPDSGFIQELDIKWYNKKLFKQGLPRVNPIYTHMDAEQCMKIFVSVPYDEDYKVDEGITVRFTNSGHMLGSAVVNITLEENGKVTRIAYTGDVGRPHNRIVKPPVPFPQADILITEATYGNRIHEQDRETELDLYNVINNTCVQRGGKLIIPSFSVGRTQEIVYMLDILMNSKPNKTGKFVYPVDKWGVDLQSEHERYLVEKHYKRPVILINYPKEIKAFYMKQNEDGKTVRAMDVLFPQIGEIIGGSQREESYEKLLATIEERNIPKKDMWWYLETRKFGTVPHSGFGLGFERLILFVTGMSNIRDVIPFPRTPKTAEF